MKKTFSFMAFAKGRVASENEFKLYWGVAPVKILAVNPDKKKLEELMKREYQEEPVYTGEQDGTPFARIDFIVQTDPKKTDIDLTTRVTFFLRKQYKTNRDNTKVQVIDPYGRTAWVTAEQLKNHEVPVYSNGKPANITKDYRKAYVGEDELTQFLIAQLNIPNPANYKNGSWEMKSGDELKSCEARLENVEQYFSGNFTEVKELGAMQPQNDVKILLGVRTTDEGKQYQNVYTRMFLKGGNSHTEKLAADVQQAKAAGAYPTTDFRVGELQEYVAQASSLDSSDAQMPGGTDDPFKID